MNRLLIAILATFLLLGCSTTKRANKHLRKAKKHILMAESLGATWQTDTVYKNIEVIVPKVKTDTIFRNRDVGDTVTITKDRLQIKYVKLAGDSVFIEGECKSDTIYKEVPITVTRTIHTPEKWKFSTFGLAFALLLVLVTLLAYGYFKNKD